MNAAARLAADAPASAAPHHNLPPATSALFGRAAELVRVRRALAGARLVSLTGPGGVGKTRLALATAREVLASYPDGVWLVELAPLADPDLVAGAVAAVLGVREEPGRALTETLAAALRGKRVLLVLDNCEHLREGCAALIDMLLGAAEGLRVLATSRAPLGLSEERRLVVPPLALPAGSAVGPEEVAATPAVALFVARAQRVEPAFAIAADNAAAVAAVCARLDGLPLAIELAAARVKVRTPQALLEELTDRLAVLIGGRRGLPARQRTVRGLLDWSFTLLSPGEQALFARLSVFAGGWTAEAAQAVCVIDDDLPMSAEEGLASLMEQSLVQPPRDGRYAMLETVREYAGYALERLSAEGDAEAARRQHLGRFLALAEEAEPQLTGPEQATWLDRLEAEHDNLRAALAWARKSGASTAGLRLAAALRRFWRVYGHLSEGRAWLEAVLAADEGGAPQVRARALSGAATLADVQGDYARAAALHEEALALRRALGDQRGIAMSLGNLGIVAHEQGDLARAAALHEEALALQRALGDQRGVAADLQNLGIVAHSQGDLARAAALHEEALAIYRAAGDGEGIAAMLHNLGDVARAQGDLAQATSLHEESLQLRRELGDQQGVALSLQNLGTVARDRGDQARAAALHEEGLALFRALGDRQGVASSLTNLGDVARDRGDQVAAAAIYDEALALARALGHGALIAELLGHLGNVALARGDWRRAAALHTEGLALAAGQGNRLLVVARLEGLARVMATPGNPEGDPRGAALLLAAAAAQRAILGAPLQPGDQEPVAGARAAAQAALGEETFAAAWAAGQVLALEEAVALARQGHDEASAGA